MNFNSSFTANLDLPIYHNPDVNYFSQWQKSLRWIFFILKWFWMRHVLQSCSHQVCNWHPLQHPYTPFPNYIPSMIHTINVDKVCCHYFAELWSCYSRSTPLYSPAFVNKCEVGYKEYLHKHMHGRMQACMYICIMSYVLCLVYGFQLHRWWGFGTGFPGFRGVWNYLLSAIVPMFKMSWCYRTS